MIPIKTEREIEIMREGGKILAKIMEKLKKEVRPGIATEKLDRLAESLILKCGGKPSFKGYQNFPATLCTSINEEIVHSLPSNRVLKEGEIISLDLGIFFPLKKFLKNRPIDRSMVLKFYPELKNGFHVDMAITIPVGKVEPEVLRLIRVCKKALKRGIKKIRPGNTVGDIGNTIQRYVESQGFNVIRDLCGHGIGKNLHEEPQVLNYGKRHSGPKLREGMVLCLEPMISMGDYKIKKSKDGFGFKTTDGSLTVHFEHTIAVTKSGYQILTEV